MKKSLILFLFLFLLANSSISFACTCGGSYIFCEVIADEEGNANPYFTIIRGQISEEKEDGINVKVEQLLAGELSDNEVFIKSGGGIDCQWPTNSFKKDETYIFVMNDSWSIDSMYRLSICHVSFLKIENEIIQGQITEDIESLPYDELSTLGDCSKALNLATLKDDISIFPNPATGYFNLKNISDYDFNTTLDIEYVDVLGRRIGGIKKENGLLIGEIWTISTDKLAAGVYFLIIRNFNQRTVHRMIKVD